MSPRAAGSAGSYAVGVVDRTTGGVRKTYDFPSVTTVIDKTIPKDALAPWAYNTGLEGMADILRQGLDLTGYDSDALKALLKAQGYSPWQKKNVAADRGQRAHNLFEELALGKVVVALDGVGGTPTVRDAKHPEQTLVLPDGYCQAVALFWAEHGESLSPFAVEEPLVSFAHRFAGTLDLGALWPRTSPITQVIVDLKTSKRVYDTHFIQLGAYALAWEEEHPGQHIERLAVLRAAEDGTYEIKEAPGHRDWRGTFLNCLALYRALDRPRKEKA